MWLWMDKKGFGTQYHHQIWTRFYTVRIDIILCLQHASLRLMVYLLIYLLLLLVITFGELCLSLRIIHHDQVVSGKASGDYEMGVVLASHTDSMLPGLYGPASTADDNAPGICCMEAYTDFKCWVSMH
jgi:hypothetical protein